MTDLFFKREMYSPRSYEETGRTDYFEIGLLGRYQAMPIKSIAITPATRTAGISVNNAGNLLLPVSASVIFPPTSLKRAVFFN